MSTRALPDYPQLADTHGIHAPGSPQYIAAVERDLKYNRRVLRRASRDNNTQAWLDARTAVERGHQLLSRGSTIESIAVCLEGARSDAEANGRRKQLNRAAELAQRLAKTQGIEAIPDEFRPLVMHQDAPAGMTFPAASSNDSAPVAQR